MKVKTSNRTVLLLYVQRLYPMLEEKLSSCSSKNDVYLNPQEIYKNEVRKTKRGIVIQIPERF